MKTSRAAALIVVGAAAVAGAAVLTWASATITDDLRGVRETTATGAGAAPALLPIAVASLAALGAVLASRGVLRRVVGALIALLGVAAVVVAVRGLFHQPLTALAADTAQAGSVTVSLSPFGPILAAIGGLVIVAAGLPILAGRTASRALGARYERSSTAVPGTAAGADPALSMWKELDADRDPTLTDDPPSGRDRLIEPPHDDRPDGRSTS